MYSLLLRLLLVSYMRQVFVFEIHPYLPPLYGQWQLLSLSFATASFILQISAVIEAIT